MAAAVMAAATEARGKTVRIDARSGLPAFLMSVTPAAFIQQQAPRTATSGWRFATRRAGRWQLMDCEPHRYGP